MNSEKKLYLSNTNKKVAGVCGGLGEYLDVDPTLIRVIWIVITIFSGVLPGVLIYVFAWIVMPSREIVGSAHNNVGSADYSNQTSTTSTSESSDNEE